MAKGETTPKRELLMRLERIVEGLRDGGYNEDAQALSRVVGSLRASVPRDAAIQEVVQRALGAVVAGEVTLAGRLIDALAYVGKQYGMVLAMHPALLVVTAVGGQDNPDRLDPDKNIVLDAVLATLIEDPEPYRESLYTLAVLARTSGLTATADLAVGLLEEIHKQGAEKMADQAREIEKRVAIKPSTDDDDFGWVIKLMLTLASITLVAATASKLAGSLKEIVAGVDEVLSLFGGSE